MVDTIPLTDLYVAGRLTADQEAKNKVSVARDLDFSNPASYELDFTTVNQDGIFGTIKSMFMDNTDNPSEVVVSVSSTQQKFTIPAYSEGYFAIIAAQQSRVRLDSDGGATSTITAVFHNWFIAPSVWYKNGNNPSGGVLDVEGPNADGADLDAVANTNPVLIAGVDRATNAQHTISVDPTGIVNVAIDGDVTIDNLPDNNGLITDISIASLSGASEPLTGVNNSRRILIISNVGATTVGVNLTGGVAAIGAAGTLTLLAGANLTIDDFVPTNAITVIGTLAAALTAYEG